MSLRVAGIFLFSHFQGLFLFSHFLLQIIYSLFTLHRPGNLEKTVSQGTKPQEKTQQPISP